MKEPIITRINYSYQRQERKIWVLNLDDLPLDKSKIMDQQIIRLGPGSFGGNHKHPRTEWFVGFGDLELVWLDENNQKHHVQMNPNGELLLIEIPPFLPHAVINKSKTNSAMLYEWADQKMSGEESVEII